MTEPLDHDDDYQDEELPLAAHLIELRRRLLYIFYALGTVFLIFLPFSGKIYTGFAAPVLRNLAMQGEEGGNMLASQAVDVFLTPLKLSLALAVFVCVPWIVYQIWAFVAPGLYRREKRLISPLIISSTILFYLGVLFAYFVILPIMFRFLVSIDLEGVVFMPDITSYMNLSLLMFFAFGLAFEVPVATIILVHLGVVSTRDLSDKRPYIILGAFVIGMFLTPPDAISQTLLAVPMLLLFESGLWVAKRMERNNKTESH